MSLNMWIDNRSPLAHRMCLMLVCLAPLAVVTGCAKNPLAPTSSTLTAEMGRSHKPITNIDAPGEKTFVLLADLHAVDDPEQSQLLGVVQIRLRHAIGDPHIFNATAMAELIPGTEPYVTGRVVDAAGTAVLTFSRGDVAPNTLQIVFTTTTTIASEIAARMVEDPEEFTAVFNTASGPAAIGTLRLTAPPEPD